VRALEPRPGNDGILGDLHVATWAATKRSLHLYAQMLGKIRVALSPTQPNWMFTPLYLSPRGLTTGTIPVGTASCEVMLDVFNSKIDVLHSEGLERSIALLPARSVAAVYADLSAALEALHIACVVSTAPQELSDLTPLDSDERPSDYDPEHVRRWFKAATAISAIFERWRSHFFGRSGIQVWWGAFDVALILFNGKHVAPPTDRGYIMKYDLDAELMNVGLYLGDENTSPFFFGYIFPEPEGAEALPMRPASASWSAQLHEWILPYDAVRSAPDPEAFLTTFLDAIYEQCFISAGWNREALTYDAPTHRRTR